MAQRGVNKVILMGNVGNEPDCRTFTNGELFAHFSLATSETWKDKNTGEDRDKTEWHRCVCYRQTAGFVQQYVHKGSKLFLEGKLQTRKWTDSQGIDRYTTEIVIDNLQMLDSRNSSAASFDSLENNPYGKGSFAAAGNFQNSAQANNGFVKNGYAPNAGYMPDPAPVQAIQDPDSNMASTSFQDDDIPF